MRRLIQGWRFYDGFRADADAPARAHWDTKRAVEPLEQIGAGTPVEAEP